MRRQPAIAADVIPIYAKLFQSQEFKNYFVYFLFPNANVKNLSLTEIFEKSVTEEDMTYWEVVGFIRGLVLNDLPITAEEFEKYYDYKSIKS